MHGEKVQSYLIMIKIEKVTKNHVEIKILEKITEEDFKTITPEIDKIMQEQTSIYLLIDATSFEGWASFKAAEAHFSFIKSHHQKVHAIAVIAEHAWLYGLAATIKIFMHPKIKVFSDKEAAQQWLSQA